MIQKSDILSIIYQNRDFKIFAAYKAVNAESFVLASIRIATLEL